MITKEIVIKVTGEPKDVYKKIIEIVTALEKIDVKIETDQPKNKLTQ